MRVPVSLMLGTVAALIAGWLFLTGSSAEVRASTPHTLNTPVKSPVYGRTVLEEPLDIDPLPQTVYVPEPGFPNAEQVKVIGRIAEGIYKERTQNGNLPYWFCGEPYEGVEAKELAMQVAWNVVRSAHLASDDRKEINVWMWAGLLLNEGGMDLCTLGINPRKTAYQYNILKPNKRTVSHTREEVLYAINHEKMKNLFPVFDLGMAQTLDIHYKRYLRDERKEGTPTDLLTWKGFYWQAEYLHDLAIFYDTDRPWTYWPGYKAAWKDFRVSKFARRLGATKEEVGRITPGIWSKPAPGTRH